MQKKQLIVMQKELNFARPIEKKNNKKSYCKTSKNQHQNSLFTQSLKPLISSHHNLPKAKHQISRT